MKQVVNDEYISTNPWIERVDSFFFKHDPLLRFWGNLSAFKLYLQIFPRSAIPDHPSLFLTKLEGVAHLSKQT